jgi:uncharacterized protein
MLKPVKKTKNKTKLHAHASHPETKMRLKRAAGHLAKVVEMVHSGRECVDILQQLSAVISALEASRVTLLQDHVRTCIAPAISVDSQYLVKDLEIIIRRSMK